MESHNSCEKLVAAEAGLVWPEMAKSLSIVGTQGRKSSFNILVNYVFMSLAIVLLIIVPYEIWQVVRNEKFINQLAAQNSSSPIGQLPFLLEDARVDDMAEQLKGVQNTVEKILEKFDQRDASVLDETQKPSEAIIPDFLPETVKFPEQDASQDLVKSESSTPAIMPESIDEAEPVATWTFHYTFGRGPDTDGGLDVTGTDLTESESSEEGWGSYVYGLLRLPYVKTVDMFWGRESSEEEDSESSESVQDVEEEIDNEDMETVSLLPAPLVDNSSDVSSYDSDYYESDYDSYDYDQPIPSILSPDKDVAEDLDRLLEILDEHEQSDTELPSSTTESTSTFTADNELGTTTEDGQIFEDNTTSNPTVEFTSASSVQEDLKAVTTTTEDTEENYPNFFDLIWGNIEDDADSIGNDTEDGSTSVGETLEESSDQDDEQLIQEKLRIEEYFRDLLEKRVAEAEMLDVLYSAVEDHGDYSDYAIPTGDYDDDLPFNDESWSYISKRSVDGQSTPDVPSESLSPKELSHKLDLLEQSIDDDNHLLQNEVSLTSEPIKQFLQTKLNNFYRKMEAVSAHIDWLHKRYQKLNKLDDDYVSKELPAGEGDAPWTPIED